MKHLLVVDDDTTHRTSLLALLEAEHFQCSGADTAETALDSLGAIHTDLVITDYNLPGATGIQLIETIAASAFTFLCPCILMTGQLDRDIAEKAKQAGAVATLRKPLDFSELLALIHRVLRDRPKGTNPQKNGKAI